VIPNSGFNAGQLLTTVNVIRYQRKKISIFYKQQKNNTSMRKFIVIALLLLVAAMCITAQEVQTADEAYAPEGEFFENADTFAFENTENNEINDNADNSENYENTEGQADEQQVLATDEKAEVLFTPTQQAASGNDEAVALMYASNDVYCFDSSNCVSKAQRQQKKCTSGVNKLALLLMTIFVGALGVNYFVTGYIGMGVGKLIVSICTWGAGATIWNLVDIIFIATSDIWNARDGCWMIDWS